MVMRLTNQENMLIMNMKKT